MRSCVVLKLSMYSIAEWPSNMFSSGGFRAVRGLDRATDAGEGDEADQRVALLHAGSQSIVSPVRQDDRRCCEGRAETLDLAAVTTAPEPSIHASPRTPQSADNHVDAPLKLHDARAETSRGLHRKRSIHLECR